jgi:hypothetical protein
MWWDTRTFDYVWKDFEQHTLEKLMKKYRGDQDYIADAVSSDHQRFLDSDRIKSWRWECINGGYNFKRQAHQNTDQETTISNTTSVLVFHGQPKPNNVQDPLIDLHWR